jgi:trimeric autotransporter adhesin
MRRFLTLVSLLCVAIPAGVSITGCYRNPDANYCNGQGYGLKITDVAYITLSPVTSGISLAFGQTQQIGAPTAKTCKGTAASVSSYSYGTSNNQLLDISPSGNMCAGTWNRNTGGGIANYTLCSPPTPLPKTGGLPYSIAYVTASANSVTSNPVQVYVHNQVTSISLVTTPLSGSGQQCFSQGQEATLDAEACYVSGGAQYELCAPASVAASGKYACTGGLAPGVTTVPDCTASIGTLSYTAGNSTIGTINTNTTTNAVNITAEQPGTTVITASVANSGSSAGYFSTCPPKSISVTLANGATSGTVTQGVTQNLTTTVIDTAGNPIAGVTLVYQSTDPIDITAGTTGAITTNFPGVASVYAICQPSFCNPSPINEIGLYGTGLPISSNPVQITTPGKASDYLWFGAPGQSQYFVPVELITGSAGSTVRLPYVPNSMLEDRLGTNLYFGSSHELMVYSTASNALSKQDTSAPGVVLAVAPNNSTILINDQQRQLFYIYTTAGGIIGTFGGMGTSASWTPDSQTLYITDSSTANNAGAGITGHTDTLYVYNSNTGFTSEPLTTSTDTRNLAITIPGVGAFISGNPTVAHTWCPEGTVGKEASMLFYPQGPTPDNTVAANTDVLAATTDGKHILGASLASGDITLSDIGVTIPSLNCLPANVTDTSLPNGATLFPLALDTTLTQTQIPAANAAYLNQVVPSPGSNLAFVTYYPVSGATAAAPLPYYLQAPGSAPGTAGSVTLTTSGSTPPTAPLFGVFSPDSSYFFVSTAGDDLVHYITIPTNPSLANPPVDSQQVAPNLPACAPSDFGCTFTAANPAPASGIVPATYIGVKPRPVN